MKSGKQYVMNFLITSYTSDPMPECVPCYCALTVKQILIKCVDFMEVHHQYFNVPDFKTLFKDVDSLLYIVVYIYIYNYIMLLTDPKTRKPNQMT